MKFLLKLILTALAAYGLGQVLPGIHFPGIGTAVAFVLILGILNAVVKPVLKFISLPITFLTLGLFLLVINVVVIQLADLLIPGNIVSGFFNSLIFGFVLSIVSSLIDGLFSSKRDD